MQTTSINVDDQSTTDNETFPNVQTQRSDEEFKQTEKLLEENISARYNKDYFISIIEKDE